jgi:hypothetical protein
MVRRYPSTNRVAEMDIILDYGLSDDFNCGNTRYLTGSGRGDGCIFPWKANPSF